MISGFSSGKLGSRFPNPSISTATDGKGGDEDDDLDEDNDDPFGGSRRYPDLVHYQMTLSF